MNDPFSSIWIYLLLLPVSLIWGRRVFFAASISASLAFLLSVGVRTALISLLDTSTRFPSVSMSLLFVLGYWIILKAGRRIDTTIGFLLFVGVVAVNRQLAGHTVVEIIGGMIFAAISILITIRVLGIWRPMITIAESTEHWPTRSFLPPGTSHTWSRSEVAERYPNAVSPLFGDLFFPAVGRATQKMGRRLGIKKQSSLTGFSINQGYVYSNMGPSLLNFFGILGRSRRIRRDFLKYSSEVYPAKRGSFWKRYESISKRLDASNSGASNRYMVVLDALRLFEDWMVNQSTSLFYVTFGLIYLRLVVLLHFPLKHKEILENLPRGLRTVSHEEHVLLFALGRRLKDNPTIQLPEDDESFNQLISLAGDRSSSYDFTEPLWRDDLKVLQDMAKAAAEEPEDPSVRFARLAEDRKRSEVLLAQRLRALHFLNKRFSEDIIQLSRSLYPLKEERQKQMSAGWGLVQRSVKGLGEVLVQRGWLMHPEDIFYLTATEFSSLAHQLIGGRKTLDENATPEGFQAQVSVRKNQHSQLCRLEPLEAGAQNVLEIPWSAEGRDKVQHGSRNQIKGKYSLPGKVVGSAVVINSQGEFGKMKPGYILVAPMTNPHWDILFGMAGGIVIESGGPMSHPMLKASEYGIPAILGARRATKRIKDGQRITIDGKLKTIFLEEL